MGIRLETGDAEADHALLQAAGADVNPEILRYPGVPTDVPGESSATGIPGNCLDVVERTRALAVLPGSAETSAGGVDVLCPAS